METKVDGVITRNYLDTLSFWREYPERDVEFVRWYPCDVDYLSADQALSPPYAKTGSTATFYMHIPFCNNVCTSCPYNKFSTRSSLVERYVGALTEEINLYSQQAYLNDVELISGYLGGGTPTALSADQLERLLRQIRSRFPIKPGCSITVESTPVDINERKLKVLMEQGVDRISLGIQTFQDKMLRDLGRARTHTRERSIKTIEMLYREGMQNICIDLMIGIPGQTMDSWEEDLDILMSLPVNSFSVYLYLVLPASDTFFRLQSGQMPACPSSEEQDAMYWRMVDKVLSRGYLAVTNNDFGGPLTQAWLDLGVKTFPVGNDPAKPYKGLDLSSFYLTDHLTHSWSKCGDMLALGSGAYGYLNHHMFLNEPDVEKYVAMALEGKIPITMGAYTDKSERMARSLVLGLKLLRVKREDFKEAHGVDMYEVFREQIDWLVEKKLVQLTNEALEVTFPRGWFYIDNISKKFYTKPNYRLPQPSPSSTDILRWRKRMSTIAREAVA
uniref:Oxygen-independent coproporphyrinogen-3 oxidase n=1 Tax=Candidatus Kentrum sp. DK TaxID=2126562 RepID=A0A450S3A3_9GAMM|nr:MAG: oxygen-independent coproporphyrinogen-3 oxidase [Candidatus Kentron sp. DK]